MAERTLSSGLVEVRVASRKRIRTYGVLDIVVADRVSGMGGDGDAWRRADMMGEEKESGQVGDPRTGRDEKDEKEEKKKKRTKSLTE